MALRCRRCDMAFSRSLPMSAGFRVYYPFRAKKLIIQNILIKFIKKGARCGKKCVILHFEKARKIAYRASKCP